MNESSNQPTSDAGVINERVKTAVNAHRVKLRVLTTTASVFGFLAVAASLLIVWAYLFMYLPKQRQMILESHQSVEKAQAANDSAGENVKRIADFQRTHIVLTDVISMAVAAVALSVGVLGLGTLTLLTVVILNRRVALNQINVSLAQISRQLQDLQTAREVTFHS